MRKTAEQILREELAIKAAALGEDPIESEDWDDWKDEQGPEFMEAMWSSYSQFAAQEVEAYKYALKAEVEKCGEVFSVNIALSIIDTVK